MPIEKLVLSLATASMKLRHYFNAHTLIVLTTYPLKDTIKKADLLNKMTKWSFELVEFDIKYEPK